MVISHGNTVPFSPPVLYAAPISHLNFANETKPKLHCFHDRRVAWSEREPFCFMNQQERLLLTVWFGIVGRPLAKQIWVLTIDASWWHRLLHNHLKWQGHPIYSCWHGSLVPLCRYRLVNLVTPIEHQPSFSRAFYSVNSSLLTVAKDVWTAVAIALGSFTHTALYRFPFGRA